MSFSGVFGTLKACKLYDFERHQWLDFAGNPTTRPINLAARNAIPEATFASPAPRHSGNPAAA
jgi:omega-6 fatty acid desaturase (delta-12 desaturase)